MVKKLLLLTLISLVMMSLGLYLAWPTIARTLVQEGLSEARARGARIAWGKVDVIGTEVSVQDFEMWVPGPTVGPGIRPPVQFEFETAKVAIPLLSLFSLSPRAIWSVNGYGGTVSGDTSSITKTPTGNVHVTHINAALHPQLRVFGLTSAVLSGTAQDVTFAPFPATRGTVALQLSSIAIPKYPEQLALLKLPPLTDGALSVEGTIKDGVIDASSIRATSSLLKADGRLRYSQPPPGGKSTAEGSFAVSLSDLGAQSVGQWLPILTNNALTSDSREFEVRITGVECSGARELKLGKLCLTVRYQRAV